MIPECSRNPGHEVMKHLPEMWPVTPSAGHWGGTEGNTRWLENRAKLVDEVYEDGAINILLVGDSITQCWGGSAIDKIIFNRA